MPIQKVRIQAVLNLLVNSFKFKKEEIECRVVRDSCEEALVIEVHQRLKELIQKHCESMIKEGKINFAESTENKCLVLVRPMSHGNFYWDKIFQTIARGLSSEQGASIESKKDLIRKALSEIISTFKDHKDCKALKTRVAIRTGKFRASVFANGWMVRYEDSDPDTVVEMINSKLSPFIKDMLS